MNDKDKYIEKPLTKKQFLKAVRYASQAGGEARTSRLRKKKLSTLGTQGIQELAI